MKFDSINSIKKYVFSTYKNCTHFQIVYVSVKEISEEDRNDIEKIYVKFKRHIQYIENAEKRKSDSKLNYEQNSKRRKLQSKANYEKNSEKRKEQFKEIYITLVFRYNNFLERA